MTVNRQTSSAIATGLLLAAFGFASVAHSETRETVDAYATWSGRGQIFQTGPNSASFVGAFSGVLFVEKDKQLLNGGNIVCPGIIEIDLNNAQQTGKGRCTISNEDGERVFSEWACSGTFAEGCNGELKFTGGTGSFEKISGGGPFMARSTIHDMYLTEVGNIVGNASGGMIIWKNVEYVLP